MKIPERDLPLFPLHTVLFPRMPLSLYVFEPRYQEMATRCLRERSGFGVLLIRKGKAELMDAAELPSHILAPQDPETLSWTIAANLRAPNADKQKLLESETVQERLERELETLQAECNFLQRVKWLRETFAPDDAAPFSLN